MGILSFEWFTAILLFALASMGLMMMGRKAQLRRVDEEGVLAQAVITVIDIITRTFSTSTRKGGRKTYTVRFAIEELTYTADGSPVTARLELKLSKDDIVTRAGEALVMVAVGDMRELTIHYDPTNPERTDYLMHNLDTNPHSWEGVLLTLKYLPAPYRVGAVLCLGLALAAFAAPLVMLVVGTIKSVTGL
jgi:hypothetical protein